MDWHLPAWLDVALPFFHPVLMWIAFGMALYLFAPPLCGGNVCSDLGGF